MTKGCSRAPPLSCPGRLDSARTPNLVRQPKKGAGSGNAESPGSKDYASGSNHADEFGHRRRPRGRDGEVAIALHRRLFQAAAATVAASRRVALLQVETTARSILLLLELAVLTTRRSLRGLSMGSAPVSLSHETRPLAESLTRALRQAGIRTLFTIPGSLMPLLHESRSAGLRLYTSTHEESLGYMAIGYYEATGEPAALLVTQGPGATNLATPLACAWRDHTPVVVLTACPPNAEQICLQDSSGRFGTPNVRSMLTPVTERRFRLDAETRDLVELTAALQAMSRPVLIEVASQAGNCRWEPSAPAPLPAPSWELLAAIGDFAGPRHTLLLGAGARHLNVAGLIAAAQARRVTLATTLRAMDLLPRSAVGRLGTVGVLGDPGGNRHLAERCEKLIVVGASLNRMTTEPWIGALRKRDATIVHLGHSGTAAVGAKSFCTDTNLAGAQIPTGEPLHIESCAPDSPLWQARRTVEARVTYSIETLRGSFVRDAPWLAGDRVLSSASHGPLGLAISLAAGSALGAPDRRHVVLCGDGGLLFSGHTFLTLRRYSLPVAVVVFVNGEYRTVADAQRRRLGDAICTDLVLPNLKLLARAWGVAYRNARTAPELTAALIGFYANPVPTLIETVDEVMP